jgi:hypothetical protein
VIVVSCTVVSEKPEEIVKASEVLARAASGLALEGINVSVNIGTVPDEEEGKG